MFDPEDVSREIDALYAEQDVECTDNQMIGKLLKNIKKESLPSILKMGAFLEKYDKSAERISLGSNKALDSLINLYSKIENKQLVPERAPEGRSIEETIAAVHLRLQQSPKS